MVLRDSAKRIRKKGFQPSDPQELVLEILRILSTFQKNLLQKSYEKLDIELEKIGEGRHFRRILYAEFMDQLESSVSECILLLGGGNFWSKDEDIIRSRGALQSVCNYLSCSKNVLENMIRGISLKKYASKYIASTPLESTLFESFEQRYASQENHKKKIQLLMQTLAPKFSSSEKLVGSNNRILQKPGHIGILSIPEQSKKFYGREFKYIHPGALKTISMFYMDFFRIFSQKMSGSISSETNF